MPQFRGTLDYILYSAEPVLCSTKSVPNVLSEAVPYKKAVLDASETVPYALTALSVLGLPKDWEESGGGGDGSGGGGSNSLAGGVRERGGGAEGTCLDRGLPAGLFPSDHLMLCARFRMSQ